MSAQSDHEKYLLATKKLFKDYPQIFNEQKMEYIPLLDYLSHFTTKFGTKFLFLPSPFIYEPEILNRYRDNLVYSTYLQHPSGGYQLNSVFQLGHNIHLSGMYHYLKKPDKYFISMCMYADNGLPFSSFLDANADLEYIEPEEQKFAGFGFGTGSK